MIHSVTSGEPAIRRGTTSERDPERAAAALHEAIWQPGIRIAIFYCAADYDLPALAAALARCFAGVDLIGCTTAGEITPQGYLSGALTGVSLAGPGVEAVTTLIPLAPFDSTAAGAGVRALLGRLPPRAGKPASPSDTFGFMLVDGLAMQEEMLTSCVHAHLEGIDLVGGSAADDTRFEQTWVYHGGRFHRHAAVLALIRTDLPFKAFRTQHFTHTGTRMVITKADPAARVVHGINGRPAAQEFARLIGLPHAELTPMVFASHPVIVRVGGQYFVRSIAKVNDDGSLTFFCAIDEGIVLTIARRQDMVEDLQRAFDDVRAAIGAPALVLGCDCVLRRLETERTGIKARIGRIFADNNVVGFATYGEQFNSMHVNQTFTGIAIGRPPAGDRTAAP